MKHTSTDRSRRTANKPPDDNRRGTERVPTQFSLMYSGMYDGRMLIGNGVVRNISEAGIGIHGNQVVKLGMDLSLFIDLPESRNLCASRKAAFPGCLDGASESR